MKKQLLTLFSISFFFISCSKDAPVAPVNPNCGIITSVTTKNISNIYTLTYMVEYTLTIKLNNGETITTKRTEGQFNQGDKFCR